MRFQRIFQAISLGLFLLLLSFATFPHGEGLPFDLFLRLDPLIGLGTMIAAREWIPSLMPCLAVVMLTLVGGRLFCGHICPFGITLDMVQSVSKRKTGGTVAQDTYEATSSYRTWKYLFLIIILAASVCSVSLVNLGSPISFATRFYGLVVHPLMVLAADVGLEICTPFLLQTSWADFAYVDVGQRIFATNGFVLTFVAVNAALAYVQPRFWCRNLCPAGAILALVSRVSLIRRTVSEACIRCGRCIRECPTACIGENPAHAVSPECIVCLRCKEVCPVSAISFQFIRSQPCCEVRQPDLSKRQVLIACGSGLILSGAMLTGLGQARSRVRERMPVDPFLLRPPGALPEPLFLARCIRCGECMKACPTNTLQPVWFMAGLEGIFSPVMVPRLAACATECHRCGQVCPTGAIRDIPLIEKNHAKVGTAWIIREHCLVWDQDKKCLVCDEVCPFNAVSFHPVPGRVNPVPFVKANRCTGCGWCECRCPVEGSAAIRVNIRGEVRLAQGSYVEKAREYGFLFKVRDPQEGRALEGNEEVQYPVE